jgi:hypothetical protein
MKTIGRNDLCFCGSGKKHKHCCLNAADKAKVIDHFWYRLRTAIDPLVGELARFSHRYFSYPAIEEAWEEFTQGSANELYNESAHLSVFMPWFYFNWHLPIDPLRELNEETPLTIAQAYVQSKRYRLDPLVVRYIEQCHLRPFSFYDIQSVRPDHGMVMRDIFTGQVVDVIERAASKTLIPHDIILAKVVTMEHIHVIEACAPISFPPIKKELILSLRKVIRGKKQSISEDYLKSYEREILSVYYSIAESLLHQTMPELQNTDGDPLLFQTLIYEIDVPQDIFEALKHLCATATEDELLSTAVRDKAGNLEEIEFPWLKSGNTRHKSWSNTIIAHIKIKKKKLTVEANSENRAEKCREILAKLLDGKARYKTKVIRSPYPTVQMPTAAKDEEIVYEAHSSAEDLVALQNAFLREHYRSWLKEKIPALGNKTPKQAIKTKEGREMVEALVIQIERSMQKQSPPVDPSIIAEMRAELSL